MDSAAADLSKITVPDEDGAINQALDNLDARIASWSSAMQQAHRALAEMVEHTRSRAAAPVENPPAKPVSPARSAAVQPEKPKPTGPAPEAKESKPAPKASAAPAPGDPPKVTRELLEQEHHRKGGQAKEKQEDAKAKPGKPAKGFAAKLKRMVGGQQNDADASVAGVDVTGTSAKTSQDEQANEPLDEDEALLATLDPKVAKVIRIKRRLSNGKKSVKELLSEM